MNSVQTRMLLFIAYPSPMFPNVQQQMPCVPPLPIIPQQQFFPSGIPGGFGRAPYYAGR